jgi:hypothetical protein
MQLVRRIRVKKIQKVVMFLPNLVRLILQIFFMFKFGAMWFAWESNKEKFNNFILPFLEWILRILESKNKLAKAIVYLTLVPFSFFALIITLTALIYASIGFFFIYSAMDIKLLED